MKFMVFGFGKRKDGRFYRKGGMKSSSLEGLSSLKANKEAVEKFKAEQLKKKQEELKNMGFSNTKIIENRKKLERFRRMPQVLRNRLSNDEKRRMELLEKQLSDKEVINQYKIKRGDIGSASTLRYNLNRQAMRGGAVPKSKPSQGFPLPNVAMMKTQTMKQSVSGAVDPTARMMAERNKENKKTDLDILHGELYTPVSEVADYGKDYKQLAKEYKERVEDDLKQSKKLYELKASGVKEVGSGNVDKLIELTEKELDRIWKIYEPLFKMAREKHEQKLENEAEEKEEAEANKPQSEAFKEEMEKMEKQQESVRKQGVGIGRKLPDISKATSKLEWIEKFKENKFPSVKPEIVSVGDDTPIKMIKFVIDTNDPDYIPANPMTIGKNVPQWDLDGNPIRNKKRDGSLPKNQSVYSEVKNGQALPFDMNDIAILSERLGIQPKNWNLSDLSRNQIGALKNIMLWKLGKITEKQTGVM